MGNYLWIQKNNNLCHKNSDHIIEKTITAEKIDIIFQLELKVLFDRNDKQTKEKIIQIIQKILLHQIGKGLFMDFYFHMIEI